MRRLSLLLTVALLAGCSGDRTERYSSPMAEGNAQKINLEAVQQAFWNAKAPNFNEWMGKFENRVNEIYSGDEVVAIDAGRERNRLTVTGFIDKNGAQGFQSDDEKLFAIVQTGDVRNQDLPYRMEGANGAPYYQGQHSILGNPFIQMMLFSHMMNYFTPRQRMVVIERHRDTYRRTPDFKAQREKNRSFFKVFRTKSDGGLKSNQGFKSRGFGKKRSWFGGAESNGSSGWSGRRSSSWGASSGWGSSGRRSGSSSGGWGGRRRR